MRAGNFFVAGTPKVVADGETWLDDGGIDGVDLRQFLTHEPLTSAQRAR